VDHLCREAETGLGNEGGTERFMTLHDGVERGLQRARLDPSDDQAALRSRRVGVRPEEPDVFLLRRESETDRLALLRLLDLHREPP